MNPTDPPSSTRSDESEQDRLYDEFLSAALRGESHDPAEFCARHGLAGTELEEWLRSLEGMLGGDGAPGTRGEERLVAEQDLPLESLGEYRLIRRLGEGGMGTVYLAEQESLRRLVALKVIRPQLVGSATAAVRFRREALAVARLSHENIVTIFGVGEEDGVSFIAMELLPGHSLAEELERESDSGRRMSPRRVLRFAAQVADALQCAHEAGLIHRDVKPSNIRISQDDQAHLIDFGLARAIDSEALTVTGPFAGSPSYASPEQVSTDPRNVDHRTDLYSLGATLYECLTGCLPFDGDTMERVFHSILVEDPRPLRRIDPALPRDLEVVVGKAMEKDPPRRYASAAELAADLRAVMELRPIRARPPNVAVRGWKWARRNRVAATALLATLLVLLVGAGMALKTVRDERQQARERRSQARELVAEARGLIEQNQEAVRSGVDAFLMRKGYSRWQQWHPLDDRQLEEFRGADRTASRFELENERLFSEVMLRLSRARQLDPETDTAAIESLLYAQKWFAAIGRKKFDLADLYRGMAMDEDGRLPAEELVTNQGSIFLRAEPAAAEIHLFRYRLHSELTPGGDQRRVPCPLDPKAAPVTPGTWSLEVTAGGGAVRSGDLIVELAGQPIEGSVLVLRGNATLRSGARLLAVDDQPVRRLPDAHSGDSGDHRYAFESGSGRVVLTGSDPATLDLELCEPRTLAEQGGVRARLVRDGVLHELELPAGLRTRVTATPLFLSERTRVRNAPDQVLRQEFGPYLAVVRLDGHETQRVPFLLHYDDHPDLRVVLRPSGTSRPGYCYVPCDARMRDRHPGFWIMEREITCAEYLRFLNDPVNRRRIDAGARSVLVPRDPDGEENSWLWPRDGNGMFELPADWSAAMPVMGISWNDARSYVDWKNATVDDLPDGYIFALPNYHEWIQASSGGVDMTYVHGETFRPGWIKSRQSRGEAVREEVMRYPIDESAFGVFDLMGGAAEWGEPPAFASGEERALLGGSWLSFQPADFQVDDRDALPAGRVRLDAGFRLVITAKEGRR